WLQAQTLDGRIAGQYYRGSTVGDLRGVARSDGAFLGERGTQLAQGLNGGCLADAIIFADHGVAATAGNGERLDLASCEVAGSCRALVGCGRNLILCLASHRQLRIVLLGGS